MNAPKIFDCFLFSSEAELDILEIRMRYLSSAVHKFVVVESNKTFSGNDKPYILEANWDRFKQWHDKIVYYQIEQDPSQYTYREVDRYSPDNGAWSMEYECRNALKYIDEEVDNSSWVVLSDVDEIWDKNKFDTHNTYGVFIDTLSISTSMQFFAYFVNVKTVSGPDVNWKGSVFSKGSVWKSTTPQVLRDQRNTLTCIPGCGWHFSWMGGVPAIQKKIKSFAHTEFDRPHILDEQAILKAIEEGRDVLQRPGVRYEVQPMFIFPDELQMILQDYPHLIKL